MPEPDCTLKGCCMPSHGDAHEAARVFVPFRHGSVRETVTRPRAVRPWAGHARPRWGRKTHPDAALTVELLGHFWQPSTSDTDRGRAGLFQDLAPRLGRPRLRAYPV